MSDYVVSEAWLRDASYANPIDLWRHVFDAEPISKDLRLHVEREASVPSGRIDLLICDARQMLIAEFKRNTADESAVAQVLRYRAHYDPLIQVTACVVAPGFTSNAQLSAIAADVVLVFAVPAIRYAYLSVNQEISVREETYRAIFEAMEEIEPNDQVDDPLAVKKPEVTY